MERFQFKKKRPYVAHKKQTPLRAPARSFSEARDDLLRSLNARIPIVLRLDRRHSSTVGCPVPRSRAASISSLDQYRKGLSNSPRYRAREVTRSLSEDAFGVSPLVITETELSSSWLYKSMKAVANGAEDSEHPTTRPQKPLKTSTTEPSLSPVPLKDPKMKPIPVPTRTPRPRSACSRFCYFVIMVLISACLLGMLSTLGAIAYIELFTNSTIAWNSGSLELVARTDGSLAAGTTHHDGRYDSRAGVNVQQGVPHGDTMGRTSHDSRFDEEQGQREVLVPGAKGSQRHRQEVLAAGDDVSEPEGYPHHVQYEETSLEVEEPAMDGSEDERTLGQGIRASEAEVVKHQRREVHQGPSQHGGSQDHLGNDDQEGKGLAEDQELDGGKEGFARRTVHIVDQEHPRPNDLSQFLDNVRTQIRRHMDESIIHEEALTSAETERSVGSSGQGMEISREGEEESQDSHELSSSGIDPEEIGHDELDSSKGVKSLVDGRVPPNAHAPSDRPQEGENSEINNSDASDVLETQYQDLFEESVKDAVTEDEEAYDDSTEARDELSEDSAFVSGRDAEQFPSGTSGEDAKGVAGDKKPLEIEEVAPLGDPPQDVNEYDDEEDDSNSEDEGKLETDDDDRDDGDEEQDGANKFSSRSGDLPDLKASESPDLETQDVKATGPPTVDKVNQFSSRSGDLYLPEEERSAHEFKEPRVQLVRKRRPPLGDRLKAAAIVKEDRALSFDRVMESQNTGSQGMRNKRPPLKGNVDAFFSSNGFPVHQRPEATESREQFTQATKNRRPPSNTVNRPSGNSDFQMPQSSGYVFRSQDSSSQPVRRRRPPVAGMSLVPPPNVDLFSGDILVPKNAESAFQGQGPRSQAVRRPPLSGSGRQQAVQPEAPRVDIKNTLAQAIKRLSVLDSKKVLQSRTKQNPSRAEGTGASTKASRPPHVQDAEREAYLQSLQHRFFDDQHDL